MRQAGRSRFLRAVVAGLGILGAVGLLAQPRAAAAPLAMHGITGAA